MFFSSIDFSGSWFGSQHLNVSLDMKNASLRLYPLKMMPGMETAMGVVKIIWQDEGTLKLHVNGTLAIVKLIDGNEFPYLKFVVEDLEKLPGKPGGLLGYDDHSHLDVPECAPEVKPKLSSSTACLRAACRAEVPSTKVSHRLRPFLIAWFVCSADKIRG